MRRLVIVGALVGIGLVLVRTRASKLHQRLMEGCERMFERMPDEFPPKKAMRAIDEIRGNTARIVDLLESRTDDTVEASRSGGASTGARGHAA